MLENRNGRVAELEARVAQLEAEVNRERRRADAMTRLGRQTLRQLRIERGPGVLADRDKLVRRAITAGWIARGLGQERLGNEYLAALVRQVLHEHTEDDG